MTRRTRRNRTPAFKAKVALAALRRDKTLAERAQLFDVHLNQIADRKSRLLEGAASAWNVGAGEASLMAGEVLGCRNVATRIA